MLVSSGCSVRSSSCNGSRLTFFNARRICSNASSASFPFPSSALFARRVSPTLLAGTNRRVSLLSRDLRSQSPWRGRTRTKCDASTERDKVKWDERGKRLALSRRKRGGIYMGSTMRIVVVGKAESVLRRHQRREPNKEGETHVAFSSLHRLPELLELSLRRSRGTGLSRRARMLGGK